MSQAPLSTSARTGPWKQALQAASQELGSNASAPPADSPILRHPPRISRTQLTAILQGISDGVTVQDAAGKIIYANPKAAVLIGFSSVEELLRTPRELILRGFELLDADGRPLLLDQLPSRRALLGEEVPDKLLRFRVRATRDERWSYVRSSPVFDDDGSVQCVINFFRDVTDKVRQDREDRLLAKTSNVLLSSLDYETTLTAISQLMVPDLADWCGVYVVGEDGAIRQLSVTHVNQEKIDLALELDEKYPADPHASSGVGYVVRTGQAVFAPEITDEMLISVAKNAEHLRIMRELGLRSLMNIPLTARGRTFGTLVFASAESERFYTQDDLEFATEIAQRAAMAVDNARLYRDARLAIQHRDESLALLNTLLTSAPVGFAFLDTELRFVRVNPSLAEMNGLPPERHIGRTLREVVPRLAERLEPMHRSILETAKPLIDVEIEEESASSEEHRTWSTSFYPVRTDEGTVLGIGAVVSDITERKRTVARMRRINEELESKVRLRTYELEQSQERDRANLQRLKDMITHMPMAAVASDEHLIVLHANESFGKLFGLGSPDNIIGKSGYELLETAKHVFTDPDLYASALLRVIQARQPLFEQELHLRDGTVLSCDYIPIVENDHHRGHLLLYRDVTREKRIDAAKSEFMSLASHQLRTPLTTMRWALGRLRRTMPSPSVTQDHILTAAQRATEHMSSTINAMLSISRIEANRVQLKYADVNMRVLLEELLQDCRAPAAAKDQSFSVECDPALVLRTDEHLLWEILHNLARNAIKYTPSGGSVRLRAEKRLGGAIRIDVIDSGIGIPLREQHRVFQKFFRAENAIESDPNGTGLGLYLAYITAKLLGAELSFVSSEGAGTTFTLHFPSPDLT